MGRMLEGLSTRQFIQALRRDGFTQIKAQGCHRIYRHSDGRRLVLAYNRFPVGAFRSMLADVGWTEADRFRLNLILW